MHAIHTFIEGSLPIAWIVLALAFIVLAKCADLFVDSSVSLANKFKIPKLVVGIVLVSLATTAPELSVSLMSAIKGKPEMALGNAIGSVICDDGLALALCGIMTVSVIPVIPVVLRTSGLFLLGIELLAFGFVAFDGTLGRWEGAVLVALFVGYIVFLFRQHKKGVFKEHVESETGEEVKSRSMGGLTGVFILGLGGIILASEFIITSATTIAGSFGIPDGVIALTLVALGTSIPEVATCIIAARRGEGAVAVGNIIGADIMNICWVAGASALVNPLTLSKKELYFMFPAMFIIVAAMLLLLRVGYSLNRKKGFFLLALYVAYLVSFFFVFPPQ